MAKKKKKVKAVDISVAPFSQVKRDLIKKLSILSEKKLVTIGASAVLRLLPRHVFGLIVTSKKLCSPLFHEINLFCDLNKIPVLSIEEEFIKELKAKTARVSIIGIKKNDYSEDKEFGQYILKLQKKKKRTEVDDLQSLVHTEIKEVQKMDIQLDTSIRAGSPPFSMAYTYRTRDQSYRQSSVQTSNTFISLGSGTGQNKFEFPTYKPFFNVENLVVSVKDKDALSFIINSCPS